MLNAIPILGWLLSALIATSLAAPFYYLWNWLAPIYFYWLPYSYQVIPFWDCVGLFMLSPILKLLLFPSFRSEQTTNVKGIEE